MFKLLERQLGLWELKRRLDDLGERAGRYLENRVAYGPCLLISRERGSGGCRLARVVGERLGWCVFDREIANQIAERAHVREQLVATVDPETRSSWGETWHPELEPQHIGLEHYLRCLRQVVLSLGHHGDVVILGRGAQYLLPPRCALRVRVVAPMEQRVQRLTQEENLSVAQAQAYLQQADVDQSEFIRTAFQRDLNSPLDYDLTINTDQVPLEAAVELVLLALRNKLGMRLVQA